MAIEKLNQGTPSTAAQLPFYDPARGQDRRCSLQDIADVIAGEDAAGVMTQYAAPNASSFNVTVSPVARGGSVWLLLTPAAGYAAGTITLPAQPVDGQEVTVSCTQAVAALTTAGSGYTVNGAPAALAANGFFGLRFDGVFQAWYRNR